jgi:hypothetical protein
LRARSRVRSSSARSVSTLARSVMSASWIPPWEERLARVPSAYRNSSARHRKSFCRKYSV